MFEARRSKIHSFRDQNSFPASIQLMTIDFTWLPRKHQSLVDGKQHFRQKASQATMVTLKRIKLPHLLKG